MYKFIVVLTLSALLSACAGRGKPIVDTQGVNLAEYRQDLWECEQYAEQVDSKAGSGAVGGAVVGGVVGSIVGDSGTAKKGAGIGAVSGFVRGAARTKAEKQRVVRNCLSQRGYRVLN